MKVVQWPGGCSIEQRIFLDVPDEALYILLQLAMEWRGEESVRDAVQARLPDAVKLVGANPLVWQSAVGREPLRRALGSAAKHKQSGWYKRIDLGEEFGMVVASHLSAMQGTGTADCCAALERFVYADGGPSS